MNSKIIVLWGIIITGIVLSIYFIGIYESKISEDGLDTEFIKVAVDTYLDEYNYWPTDGAEVSVLVSRLIDEKYIDNVNCSGSVYISMIEEEYVYSYDVTCIN